ncbi:hypothetical protein D3C73_1240910 [compost metagenome]
MYGGAGDTGEPGESARVRTGQNDYAGDRGPAGTEVHGLCGSTEGNGQAERRDSGAGGSGYLSDDYFMR